MSIEMVLIYAFVPVVALIFAAMIAVFVVPRDSVVSLFQHFAAGVVFAVVAVELLPVLKKAGDPFIMTVGFILGVITMLLIGKFAEKMGMVIPIAVDLFVDGMLVAIGFAAGSKGGFILLTGLSMEAVSLGLSEAPSPVKEKIFKEKNHRSDICPGCCASLRISLRQHNCRDFRASYRGDTWIRGSSPALPRYGGVTC